MNRPFIHVNCASSIDGKIALADGCSLKISDEKDMARVYKLRNTYDAVLVGINTVLSDDPKLTVKEKYVSNVANPLRVVLDSKCRTPETAEVLKPNAQTLLVTTCSDYKSNHIEAIKCGDNSVDIQRLMRILTDRGIKTVLVEGGSDVIWEFIRLKLVDKITIFFSPILIGGHGPTIAGGKGALTSEDIAHFTVDSIQKTGKGYIVTLIPK